jgi:hypothetical protein
MTVKDRRMNRLSSMCCLTLAVLVGSVTAQKPLTVRPILEGADRLADWTLDGTGGWEISEGKLSLVKAGKPGGPFRRPGALAILKSPPFTRVTVEVELRSTAPPGLDVRDLDLVVGYESQSRFYYVHLAGRTDAVHNGIFLVADADRRRIDARTGVPQLKDQNWHRVRLERDPSTGSIEVYVDGSVAPVLKASDTTIQAGRVGFGSFDETGEFRAISVTGTAK